MASIKSLLTNLTIGASSAAGASSSLSPALSILSVSRSKSMPSSLKLAKLSAATNSFSISRWSLSSSTTTVSTLSLLLKRIASMASTRVGSLMAIERRLPRLKIGRIENWRTIFSSTISRGIASLSSASRSNSGSPNSCEIMLAIWRAEAPVLVTKAVTRVILSRCDSAMARCMFAAVTTPSFTRRRARPPNDTEVVGSAAMNIPP